MITDIVGLAQELMGLRETLRGARAEKRDRLATYFEQIGNSLEAARDDLRAGGAATRACSQLHQYVDLIPPTVDEALGAERTGLLRERLRSALYLRGLPSPTSTELDQLDEAAGAFSALAAYLRAST